MPSHVPAVDDEREHREKQNEERSQSGHQSESPERKWDVRNHLLFLLDVTVTEVFHVGPNHLEFFCSCHRIALFLCFPIGHQCNNRRSTASDLLLHRRFACAILPNISVQQVINARHKPM